MKIHPLVLGCALALAAAAAGAATAVQLEELSWTELRTAQQAGMRTVIVPVGGTEQNGPHMALGKHNARVRVLAARIAQQLGDTLVAPVLAYVPEGRIDPPQGHMRYPGTISVSDAAFQGVLEGAARSLRQGGFEHIVLIGDSGNYQDQLQKVATRLNREWGGRGARVHALEAYYQAAQAPFARALRQHGLSPAQIGTHAGAADTALLLATAPALVRIEYARADADGVQGDPRAASVELGGIGAGLIVDKSVASIRQARAKAANR